MKETILEKEEKKFGHSDILEGMTSISALLNAQCENDRKIQAVWIDQSKRKSKSAEIGFLTAKYTSAERQATKINAART